MMLSLKLLLYISIIVYAADSLPSMNIPSMSASGCNNHDIHDESTITSPYYPHHYPLSTTCIYTIFAPENKKVHLNFGSIRTEDCCDYLEVFDGSNIKSKRLSKFAGSFEENEKSFESSTNSLTLRFYSDLTVTYNGFTANITFV
ncbi:unnamed protein product [Auanema sp. JU1783]|nr:unnamed protein product [Auanema sp. JU1783]